jgi:serine/threonine protein kinase
MAECAKRWRAMGDADKQPFLAQAEKEKRSQLEELKSKGIPFRQTPYVKQVLAGLTATASGTPLASSADRHSVGEYEIPAASRASTGSYGMVRPGFHQHTGARAAIKVYNFASKQEAEREVDIYNRIAKADRTLRCHLPCLLQAGHDAPLPFIALSWRGTSVQRLLPVSDDVQALAVIAQAEQAVRALHQLRIIHTDIKPDNVLLRLEDNRVTLIDFQYSEVQGADGACAPRSETYSAPQYRPPEMWAAKTFADLQKALSPAVDIWAYGVLVMRLLLGKSLFRGVTEKEVMNAICHEWQKVNTRQYYIMKAQNTRDTLMTRLLARDPEFVRHLSCCLNVNANNRCWR